MAALLPAPACERASRFAERDRRQRSPRRVCGASSGGSYVPGWATGLRRGLGWIVRSRWPRGTGCKPRLETRSQHTGHSSRRPARRNPVDAQGMTDGAPPVRQRRGRSPRDRGKVPSLGVRACPTSLASRPASPIAVWMDTTDRRRLVAGARRGRVRAFVIGRRGARRRPPSKGRVVRSHLYRVVDPHCSRGVECARRCATPAEGAPTAASRDLRAARVVEARRASLCARDRTAETPARRRRGTDEASRMEAMGGGNRAGRRRVWNR